MAQEINEQEHIEKPKSPRRAAGTRKKAAASSGTEAGTDTDARADAGSAASGQGSDGQEQNKRQTYGAENALFHIDSSILIYSKRPLTSACPS